MRSEIRDIKSDIRDMKGEMYQMKLFQENMMMPRLNTIEACYTGTFKRYKAYADKMDTVFSDVDLLKKVVTEHSEKNSEDQLVSAMEWIMGELLSEGMFMNTDAIVTHFDPVTTNQINE